MAKKQIKELVIKTSSPGSKETNKELQSIQKALEQTEASARNINRQFGGSIKVISKLANEYGKIAASVNASTKSVKAFNSALNGDTKVASKRISSYMENIELLTISMRELQEESAKTANNLDRVGSGSNNKEVKVMANFIEQLYLEIVQLNGSMDALVLNTRESIETLDRLADRITDVEVQTKKSRLQTEALGSTLQETTVKTKKYSASTEKATNDTRRLAGAGSQGARAFSDLAFRMNPIVSLYATIAVNVYAATEAFRLLNEAANLNRLNNQTARFAATLSGIDIKSLSQDLQEMSGNAINAGDALRQSVRGVAYGFAADDLERLTVGARKASVALGIDFADAMDRAFRGIAKQEVEVLDEIGVVTRLDTAFKKYASSLGKTADDLTEVERRTALTVEVISQLEKRFSSFDVTATGVEQLGVAMKDLVDNTLIQASGALDGIAKRAASVVRGFSGVSSASDRVARAQEIYNEAIAAGEISQAAVAYSQVQEALELLRLEQTKGTEQNERYQKSVEEAEAAQSILQKGLALGTVVVAGYAAVLAVQAIIAVSSFTAGVVASTAALSKKIIVGASYRATLLMMVGLNTAASATFAVYSGAVTAAAAATLAFAKRLLLLLAPIGLVLLKVGLIAAAIGLVGYSILKVVDLFTGGAVFSAIGDFFDWIGEKISSFLSWIGVSAKSMAEGAGEMVGSLLDVVASATGLDDLTSKYLGLDKAQEQAVMTAEEYKKSLIAISNPNFIANALSGVANITRAQAEANLAYINSSKDLITELGTNITELNPPQTAFDKFASTVKGLAEIPLTLKYDTAEWKLAENRFKELQGDGVIPIDLKFDDAEGWTEFNNRVEAAQKAIQTFTREGSFDLERMSKSLLIGDPAASLKAQQYEQSQLNTLKEAYSKLGEEVAKEERAEIDRKIKLLELDIKISDNVLKYAEAQRSAALANNETLESVRRQTSIESKLLEVQAMQLEAQIATAKLHGHDVTLLQHELKLLNQKINFAKYNEELEQRRFTIETERAQLENRMNSSGSARERTQVQQELNALKQAEINLMVEGIEKQRAQAALDRENAQANRESSAAFTRDFAAVASSMGGMSGLTEMQSTALNSISSINDVYASFQENMKSSSMSFFEFLKGDIEAFGQVAQAGLQFAQGIFAMASKAKVDSINREIEAEKRRDGKSAESQKKIRALEAKRIKEEAKAKKASVIMSTATAVMQGFAQLGPIGGAILAIPTIAFGLMQLSQIDKAAAGQVAGLGGSANLALEGGSRTNQVDVSSSANAGELSYLRGESGTGSISNFNPGRASGNYSSAGTSITVGESGPEEITPAVPVNVTPSGSSGNKPPIIFSPIFHASAIDSEGMEELLMSYSRQLYDGLETELRARNKTLDNL